MRTRASPGQGPTPNFSCHLLTLCGDILKERHLVPHFLHKVKCVRGTPLQNGLDDLYIKGSGIVV